MKSIIENLENLLDSTTEITVIDKREDGFTYMFAIKSGEDTFVVYTTRGIHHYKKESCFIMMQVTEHIPFNSVTATVNGDIVTPYKQDVRDKRIQVGQDLYGVQAEELPFFQKAL